MNLSSLVRGASVASRLFVNFSRVMHGCTGEPIIPGRLLMDTHFDESFLKPTLVISEFMELDAVAQLADDFNVLYEPDLVDRPQDLLRLAARADALIVRNRTQVRGALLEALSKVAVIGRLGVGLDNIDVDACRERGIRVIAATGANAQSVAEYVITAALVLTRNAFSATNRLVQREWPRSALSQGREINARQLGLIGFGLIGQLTAQLARGLGMRVVAYDPFISSDGEAWRLTGVQPVDLSELLRSSDVVSLHVPLNSDTSNFIDEYRIKQFKPGAVLINTARGEILDAHAVVAALRSGHLGGAALDVFSEEPPQNPEVFADVPNLILTPHVAGLTVESNKRVSDVIAREVTNALVERAGHGNHQRL